MADSNDPNDGPPPLCVTDDAPAREAVVIESNRSAVPVRRGHSTEGKCPGECRREAEAAVPPMPAVVAEAMEAMMMATEARPGIGRGRCS